MTKIALKMGPKFFVCFFSLIFKCFGASKKHKAYIKNSRKYIVLIIWNIKQFWKILFFLFLFFVFPYWMKQKNEINKRKREKMFFIKIPFSRKINKHYLCLETKERALSLQFFIFGKLCPHKLTKHHANKRFGKHKNKTVSANTKTKPITHKNEKPVAKLPI